MLVVNIAIVSPFSGVVCIVAGALIGTGVAVSGGVCVTFSVTFSVSTCGAQAVNVARITAEAKIAFEIFIGFRC